jgi:hypothetical protein
MPIEVIPHEKYLEMLPERVIMCARYYGGKTFFEDDEIRKCNRCEHEIVVRPYNLIAKELVCIECMFKEIGLLTKESKKKLEQTAKRMERVK